MTRFFEPSKTIEEFMESQAKIQLLLGPIGGGKTVGVLMKLLMLAHAQAPNDKGFRRTRWAVVRNTRPQLKDSVLKTVFDWLEPDGKQVLWRESDMTLELNIQLPDHTKVECEIMFRALDDERDARRLLSVEYTGVWFSEFREIPFQLHRDALSRCGRFPSAADGGCTWHGMLGETNMPTKGSDWFRFLELELPSFAEKFIQPSGIGPDAENLKHLPVGYYTTLAEGANEGWVQAHIKSEYPDSLDGKAVYAQTFSASRHVHTAPLRPYGLGSSAGTLLIGIDQGRNPAAVIGQMQPSGRLHILEEIFEHNMGMEKFAQSRLLPVLQSRYAGMPMLGIIDPAGEHKNEVDDRTPKEMIEQIGLMVISAPTNNPDRRIAAVESRFLLHDGILISPECKQLIEGAANSYRYKTKKDGQLEDRPEKLHPYSDLHDALQYLCLVAGGNAYGRALRRIQQHGNGPAIVAPPIRGWC